MGTEWALNGRITAFQSGVWETGSKGQTSGVPSEIGAEEMFRKNGGGPDLPERCVKTFCEQLQTSCGALGGPGPCGLI